MKFTITREQILPVLAAASRIAGHQSHLPILRCLLITAEEGRLRIQASNLEYSLAYWLPCDQITRSGTGAVPAQLLTDFVQQLPAAPITFDLNPETQTLHLDCAYYQADLRTLDPADFPTPPTPQGAPLTALALSLFRALVPQVQFAASTNDTRPVLSGVLHHFHDQDLTLVGADGFRLAARTITLDEVRLPGEEPQLQLIVPARALGELVKILPEPAPSADDPPVGLSLSAQGNHLIYHTAFCQFAVRLIEGNYPGYTRIIAAAQGGPTRATVATSELRKALQIAAHFAREDNQVVRLTLTPAAGQTSGQVIVQATSDSGSTQSCMEAFVEGPATQIAFNTRFLVATLGAIGAPLAVIEIRAPDAPGIVRAGQRRRPPLRDHADAPRHPRPGPPGVGGAAPARRSGSARGRSSCSQQRCRRLTNGTLASGRYHPASVRRSHTAAPAPRSACSRGSRGSAHTAQCGLLLSPKALVTRR